jgi:hypothetical protein
VGKIVRQEREEGYTIIIIGLGCFAMLVKDPMGCLYVHTRERCLSLLEMNGL